MVECFMPKGCGIFMSSIQESNGIPCLFAGGGPLSTAQLSKITDLISAPNALRFCTEYLDIDSSQYSIIGANVNHNHHDTMYGCLEHWKNQTEGEGRDAYRELYTILKAVQQTRGWFSMQALNSVFEDHSASCEFHKNSQF